MTRLLLDENVALTAGRWLDEQGHDIQFVADLTPAVDDRGVIALARQKNRILVTPGADFADLICWHGVPPHLAVICVRIDPGSSQSAATAAAAALASDVKGKFVVATTDALRHRALSVPGASGSEA